MKRELEAPDFPAFTIGVVVGTLMGLVLTLGLTHSVEADTQKPYKEACLPSQYQDHYTMPDGRRYAVCLDGRIMEVRE